MYKRRPRHFEEWERQAILDAYASGEKLVSIAHEFDTTDTTITSLARRAGIPRDRKKRLREGTLKRPDVEKLFGS